MPHEPLRIALLSYRGNPHSGGQGVYVHYLSAALTKLGHRVEVFAGPPYPELADDVRTTRLPSLDLYRADDPFRRPAPREVMDPIDLFEFASMCTASFPEPLTFSVRALKELRARRDDFDIVHDNQCLGYGLLGLKRAGFPVVATVHHPCTIDRDLALAQTAGLMKRTGVKRWYSFTRMQGRVARRLPKLVAVSDAARSDVAREFRVDPANIAVVHNGVDADLFRPLADVARVPGQIVTTASADAPLKGLVHLIEAVAKTRTERDARLVVIGSQPRRGLVAEAIERFGVGDVVRFETGIDRLRLVRLYAESEVAAVPSLYEGFSLPAIEAMSCGLPLVATTGGALPEVVGRDGDTALLVPPGDAGSLAVALGRLFDDAALRRALGRAGRRRVLERYTWAQAASKTAAVYADAIATETRPC